MTKQMINQSALKRLGISVAFAGGLCAAYAAVAQLSSFNKSIAPEGKNTTPSRVSEEGQQYLLVGKSAFDEEGENVYGRGGELRSFKTTVNFDDENGKVSIQGLTTGTAYAQMSNPAVFNWDKENLKISANTPENFTDVSQAVCLIEFEGAALTFNAGEMYGAGYWRPFTEMTMNVNKDLSVIHPQSAYAITENWYDSREESYSRGGLAAVMFDVNLYRMEEGPWVYSSDTAFDFGRCYIGESAAKTLLLVNPGTEDADYAVKSNDESVTVSQKYGVIPAGEWVELTITFSPKTDSDYNTTVSVMGEQNIAAINVTGKGEEKPDYSTIVNKGDNNITFNTSNEYPFVISEEYKEGKVAVSTNKGVAQSDSWFDVTFTVPEGKRGNLSYEGYFYPRYAAYDYFYVAEGEKTLFETDDDRQYFGELNGTLSFIPGQHTVRFCYSKGSQPNVPSVTMGEDYTYISGLSLDFSDYLPHSFELNNEGCNFGKIYTMDDTKVSGSVIKDAFQLRNTGYENLIITGMTSADHFSAAPSTNEIAPDATASINVAFAGYIADNYKEDVVLHTNAGDVTLHCEALLLNAPDYQSIVKEGDFRFEMGVVPFIVTDGKMHNDPSEAKDGEKVTSEISARFEVPEGKCGLLTWDGYADCGDGDEGMIMIDQNIFQMLRFSSAANAGSLTAKPTQCYLAPGEHLISFGFTSCGSSEYDGEGVLSISNLSLQLLDKIPGAVVWEELPVEMNPMFPGHTDNRAIALWNVDYTKQNITKVESVECPDGFTSNFDSETELSVNPLSSRDLVISFTPEKKGLYEGNVIVHTSAGDVTIPVKGEGKDDTDLLFYEDFENDLEKWTIIDRDNDDNTWKLAPASMAYIGSGALQFNSNFASGDSNDYIISPEITIPETGAVLTFYGAYNMNNSLTNEYYVAVGTGDDPSTYEKVFSEDDFSRTFDEMTVDLKKFAGQTVRICFANVSPADKRNILKIDEVSVMGISVGGASIISCDNVVKTEYYTISGVKIESPCKGIYIVKETLANGTTKVYKKVMK